MYKCVQLFATKNKKIIWNLAKYVYLIFRELFSSKILTNNVAPPLANMWTQMFAGHVLL